VTLFCICFVAGSLSTEEKMTVLSGLKKGFRNPLIPNFRNERAIDLTNDADLNTHRQFKPKQRVMQWFGPLFRKRVCAFLLVLKRLRMGVCKDVRLLLIKYMSKGEHIYVPYKE
jgi:hypothetical protein